ncbi:MAG: peptide chain release factor N(5)-glutamine methyltransferase [Flavobacteriaceae bacterium]|nr:peptide chain release factor N(5)-glutamine methyltransferase [Flavobacteriaceae bacterium]
MTLGELKDHFESELFSLFPKEEVRTFFSILLDHSLNYSRIDTVTRSQEVLGSTTLSKFYDAIKRLKRQEPIQYIIGSTEFYGLPFLVNEHTLIPRPETEELVDWVLKEIPKTKELNILDIGTGSGCIAIALAKHLPWAKVSAMDISEEAVQIARENAKRNEVAVEFLVRDILEDAISLGSFDLIVSNPPYVREMERTQMQRNVLEYEPDSALFVSDEDPLIFYRTISRFANKSLKPGGFLFFEINEYLGKEMTQMLSSEGYKDPVTRKDLFGKDRMIKCTPYDASL